MGILLLGIVVGCLNALLAVGLVLIYRTTRVINFAQGAIGGSAAVFFVQLLTLGWNYFAAALVSLLCALVAGAAVEVLVIRRFASAPRLLVMVVTLALGQVFTFAAVILPRVVGGAVTLGGTPRSPLHALQFTIAPTVFYGDHVLIVVATLVVGALVALFLKRTPYGLAVRAAAENGERATLCGVPIKTLSTLVWTMAAGLSALAAILQAPVFGVNVTSLGPTLLLRGLAAAVIGRMESLPITIAAAIGVGVFSQEAQSFFNSETVADSLLIVVILAGLLLPRMSKLRFNAQDASTWKAVAEVRGIPAELARLPVVWLGRWAVYGVLLLTACLVPLALNASQQDEAAVIAIWALVAVSLVVLTGWSGQISIGQFGLVAAGAVIGARVALSPHGDFFISLLAAMAGGAVIAVILGLPALRLQGFFLAAVTLAFAVTMYSVLLIPLPFVPSGAILKPQLLGRFDLNGDLTFYYVCLAILVVTVTALTGLRRSRAGRAITGVRDNERAAQAYGVNTIVARLNAFAISGGVAGMAGALLVFEQGHIYAAAFTPDFSVEAFAATALGGIGSFAGAIAGTLYVKGADFLLPNPWQLLASGAGLILLLLLLPQGLGSLFYRLRDAALRAVARRAKVVVPSLLADVRVTPPPADGEAGVAGEVRSGDLVGAGDRR